MQVFDWRMVVEMAMNVVILEAAGAMFDNRDQWMVFMCAFMTRVRSGWNMDGIESDTWGESESWQEGDEDPYLDVEAQRNPTKDVCLHAGCDDEGGACRSVLHV